MKQSDIVEDACYMSADGKVRQVYFLHKWHDKQSPTVHYYDASWSLVLPPYNLSFPSPEEYNPNGIVALSTFARWACRKVTQEDVARIMADRERIARLVYDILVREAGALECYRDSFVYNIHGKPAIGEFRFQGLLGFGGKFHATRDRYYVDCYPEDMTPEREAVIAATNEALKGVEVWRVSGDAVR